MLDYSAAREAMVDCQIRPSDVTQYPIIDAFLKIPREKFIPKHMHAIAYVGDHIFITENRAILDPRVFAKMLNTLAINKNELVLDIGCASGYSTALIARLSQAVVGIENDTNLVKCAEETLMAQNIDNTIIVQNCLTKGNKQYAPYDAMIIEGSIEVFPSALEDQLKEGGRVVTIFNTNNFGQCYIGIKTSSGMTWRPVFDASAPLFNEFKKNLHFSFPF